MGFHTHYRKRKDWRRGREQMKGCRPIGGCNWCMGNKRHRLKKQLLRAVDEEHIDGYAVRPRRKTPGR